MVRFRKFNLLDSPGWLDDVDLVFCRNVLMYFDSATRLEVLEHIADTLAADGALLLGESETPGRGSFVASDDGAGIYVKSRAALARAG
jgi:chemotaxis protein methyltransferase CheR